MLLSLYHFYLFVLFLLPSKVFGLLATDSLQRWELSWLAAGWVIRVIVQDRLNNAPTWRITTQTHAVHKFYV